MANTEHLEILKQGVEVWNRWREENKDVKPDLSGEDLTDIVFGFDDYVDEYNWEFDSDFTVRQYKCCDLSYCDLSNTIVNHGELSQINFTGANLERAYLYECNLRNAIFNNASLTNAGFEFSILFNSKLISANLEGVNFRFVNLIQADLSNANLKEAKLGHAIFFSTILTGTNFERAEIGEAIFGHVDLSEAKKLDKILATSSCTIDFQTLKASKNLSRVFLQKIGLPDSYIEYLPDFYDETPIRLHPVFISHSWLDKPFATKLYEALIDRNVRVWFDVHELKPGDDIREGISKGIDLYDKFILVCSKNSLENSSWVDREIERAIIKEDRLFKERKQRIKTIIPIKIDDYVHNDWDSPKRHDIQRYVIGDFKDWQDDAKFEKALDALVAALNADRGEDRVPSYL